MNIELKEQYEDFLLLGKEVCLKILRNADEKRKLYLKNNDIEAVKNIENELFPKYEKLFMEFSLELAEEIDGKKMENIEKIIYEIIEIHKFDENYLWEEVRKRIQYEKNSGAEVVKKLYEYQKNEISDKINILEQKARKLSEKQKKLEMGMADAIQSDKEMEYFELIKENGKKLDLVDEKIVMLLNKIDEIDKILATKWKYEIYGTVSKETLLKTYKTL